MALEQQSSLAGKLTARSRRGTNAFLLAAHSGTAIILPEEKQQLMLNDISAF